MASRMARGSSLSDKKNIQQINQDFVPLTLNLSDVDFPQSYPAMKPWIASLKQVRKTCKAPERGFSTTVVITPDANDVIATSGSGYHTRWQQALNYNPSRYSAFLKEAKSRFELFKRLEKTDRNALNKLKETINNEVKSRNHSYQE